jgi:hypothetical protein
LDEPLGFEKGTGTLFRQFFHVDIDDLFHGNFVVVGIFHCAVESTLAGQDYFFSFFASLAKAFCLQ